MARERAGWPGRQETHPDSARTHNPLFSDLGLDTAVKFTTIVNEISGGYGGSPMGEPPFISIFRDGRGVEVHRVVITVPYDHLEEDTVASLRGLLQTLNPEGTKILEGSFLQPSVQGGFFQALRNNRVVSYEPYYYLAPSFEKGQNNNPYLSEGIYLLGEPFTRRGGLFDSRGRNKHQQPGIPTKGQVEIHLGEHLPSEVELAYETVLLSLILANRIDLSSEEKRRETLPLRREVFMKAYHTMLRQMIPPTTRDEIFGLDQQIADIKRNLYGPLRKRDGRPMNTILLGAPGVGKSFVIKLFDFDPEVLTIPLPVAELNNFEDGVLKYLARIKKMFDIPVVVVIDDIEGLFHDRIMIGNSINTQELNPARRAKALSLLERMEDTHGIFLLCAINYPDVEPAFLRRLNPVYFPLPSENQRRHMLQQIVPADVFGGRGGHQLAVDMLAKSTEGFNYSGLAVISDYLRNALLAIDISKSLQVRRAATAALEKARERTNVAKLRELDDMAREIIRIPRITGTG